MKKFIILLAVAASSLSLFSCTTDDSELADNTVSETELAKSNGLLVDGYQQIPDTDEE